MWWRGLSTDPLSRRDARFMRVTSAETSTKILRPVAVEAPVAVEFNGIGYAVMMATPEALIDFAYGFARSERLIAVATDVVDVDVHAAERGTILRITLKPHCADQVVERVRHRVSESGCGLCGIENLEQALRPLPCVTDRRAVESAAIFRALAALAEHQPLNRATGAVHAAALCSGEGAIRLVREDVGRHNAFDKLLGAMMRDELAWDGGFALLSSRCSYELVEKATLADCPTLVSISAPTSLALDRAKEVGLPLVVLARSDALLRVGE
jgi:FdhD protein